MSQIVATVKEVNLLELSSVLSRIANEVSLAAKTAPKAAEARNGHGPTDRDTADPSVMLKKAEEAYSDRRRRERLFDEHSDLLGDHAFDMMLYLLIGHLRRSAISVSNACYASGAPQTTGLRYVAKLEERSLVVRSDDPFDKRRQLLSLTEAGQALMKRCLGEG